MQKQNPVWSSQSAAQLLVCKFPWRKFRMAWYMNFRQVKSASRSWGHFLWETHYVLSFWNTHDILPSHGRAVFLHTQLSWWSLPISLGRKSGNLALPSSDLRLLGWKTPTKNSGGREGKTLAVQFISIGLARVAADSSPFWLMLQLPKLCFT